MKQGNPRSEWAIEGDGNPNIQGFATEISTNVGRTVDFKIATELTNYRIEIYRLGYYGGDGARKVATIEKDLAAPQVQPHPFVDYEIGLIDCANWNVSASWQVPTDAVSGVYIAKLIREDGTEGASHIPFIVRDDASTSDIVFQTSDTTWQAYNAWGGASLYTGNMPTDPDHIIGWGRQIAVAQSWQSGARQGQLQPADHNQHQRPAVRMISSSVPNTPRSAGWSRTATMSPISRALTRRATARRCSIMKPSYQSVTTNTGPQSSARTSRRRATLA